MDAATARRAIGLHSFSSVEADAGDAAGLS
jgi:hypothetical protein